MSNFFAVQTPPVIHSSLLVLTASLAAGVSAVRPFIGFPDSGADLFWANLPAGQLPPLNEIWSLNAFQWSWRHVTNTTTYNYYTAGAVGEFSYRNNLESYGSLRMRPRMSNRDCPHHDPGPQFLRPFYITSCGRVRFTHPDGELGILHGASRSGLPYLNAASTDQETLNANRATG
ncbi:hypothetical protein DHEL01_v211103 [Diaporthe helianthi]|uniref:FMN-dependent dehydrogenase domain-containing protein n=1 Tax=Diaporthe helianthi TaxID=158607 RepID=A0A2P5HJV0_DIAHE|nr:hypothetical protein DHEL01_v211103 [Diaporthe helianthi]